MLPMPHLKQENGVTTLYVDGEPFTVLGGEIHNSSSSSLAYMEERVWPYLRGLHLNAVIVPVSWEMIEPSEGAFDFTLVEGILKRAREEGLRLVLLWFGLWKNGLSSYAPAWVKRDYRTYFRARYGNGAPSETISPLCDAAVEADARAFARLMAYLRETDGETHTVIMMQVENEVGLLGAERDFGEAAERAFAGEVPAAVAEAFGTAGTWSEAFGEAAGETFMAYSYACAIERIAAAGHRAYPLPMMVNAWLDQFPDRPGAYPSGGPIAKMMRVWRIGAPTIAVYAPDIYLPHFREICEAYTQDGNPLLIPEARRDLVSASNVFHAIGRHNALGFSPFGIEDFLTGEHDEADASLLEALNIEQSGFVLNGTGPHLALSYALLGNMLPVIHRYRGTGAMTGFVQQRDKGCILSFGKYDVKITYGKPAEGRPAAAGLVIETGEDSFYLAGFGYAADFMPKRGEAGEVGYIAIEEGRFDKTDWQRRRVLNGDEGAYGVKLGREPGVLRVEVYRYA